MQPGDLINNKYLFPSFRNSEDLWLPIVFAVANGTSLIASCIYLAFFCKDTMERRRRLAYSHLILAMGNLINFALFMIGSYYYFKDVTVFLSDYVYSIVLFFLHIYYYNVCKRFMVIKVLEETMPADTADN